MIRVGAELIVFETESSETEPLAVPAPFATAGEVKRNPGEGPAAAPQAIEPAPSAPAAVHVNEMVRKAGRVMASPASRRRAKEAGLDLAQVGGSGPGGRITRGDLEAALSGAAAPAAQAATATKRAATPGLARRTGTEEVKVIGVRRVIANRMTDDQMRNLLAHHRVTWVILGPQERQERQDGAVEDAAGVHDRLASLGLMPVYRTGDGHVVIYGPGPG